MSSWFLTSPTAVSRLARNSALAFALTLGLAVAWLAGDPAGAKERLSLLTAWACMASFAGALAIGPLTALRTGRPVLNHLLRRDLGIWTAITALAHLGFAMAWSMNYTYLGMFVDGAMPPPTPAIRHSLYVWATSGGFGIGAIFLLLLGLSSNRSLRRLGPTRWKRLQRASYLAFFATVIHGVIFQIIEGRAGGWLVALALATGLVLVLQIAGWRAVREAAAHP